MIRMQVQLTEPQVEKLKRLARRREVSLAAIVREAVDNVGEDESWDAVRRRALDGVGRLTAAGSDVAENHDRYLDEAYGH